MSVHAIAKSVYVCDDVVHDPTSGKPSLLNVWDTVRVPAAGEFPYRLGKLRVFVCWRGGVGRLKSKVEVVWDTTGLPIATTATLSDCVLDFSRRRGSVFAVYKFDDLIFPEPGYYYVEVYCEEVFVDDLSIQVIHDAEA